jgi:hypothetical protein
MLDTLFAGNYLEAGCWLHEVTLGDAFQCFIDRLGWTILLH